MLRPGLLADLCLIPSYNGHHAPALKPKGTRIIDFGKPFRLLSKLKFSTQQTKRGETVDQDKEKAMYDNADKFINLANEMSKTENQGQVGVAIRYAAA